LNFDVKIKDRTDKQILTFCGDCVKTCEDVAPNFGEKRPECFTMTTPRLTLPFSPYSRGLAPCDFFLFPKMKLKLKGRRFDTIEEIKAESQRVFDTVTDKDFQRAFKKRRKRWERCLCDEGNYFEGDGGR
jgi:hypothetical protein